MAVREPERFTRLVGEGSEGFAEEVLAAEGLDPALEPTQFQGVRESGNNAPDVQES